MSLVAWWPLHEDSGSTVYDIVGSNDGTVNGPTQGAAGILGTTCYDFDGTNDYVDTNYTVPSPINQLSISVWFNADSASSVRDVWGINDGGSSGDFSFEIYQLRTDSGNIVLDVNSADDASNNISTSISTGDWYHAIASVSGGEHTFYLNGESVATKNFSLTPEQNPAIGIGAQNKLESGSETQSNYFDGRITDFRIYDHALSAQEVQYLYEVGVGRGTWGGGEQTL